MAANDPYDWRNCSSVSANSAEKEKGSPISVITSLQHVLLLSSSFKNAAQTRDDQCKRKMPHLIDFFSSAHKYHGHGNKVDDQELNLELSLRGKQEISISTELSLWFGPHNTNKKRKMVAVPIDDDDDVDLNIAPPVNLNREEWEIKKILKRSDIDGSSRLLLGKQLVQEYILPHIPGIDTSEAEGIEIAIWDVDTRTEHVLVLKQWSTGSFVMTKNWMSGFVKRRGLKENDEIGLRWDDENSRLEFTILNGARNQLVRRS